ncbi:alpha/beta hydrolase [Ruegeria sp. R13_0]|uniref:alpha/beta fold hydrolase n=1 Tax=Ruegeria sp. R13_0 TaxID=2821099 RepID=UPI001ADAB3BD|nr:alpha/beta hydrolase [Ruegeria sp. R13_0]MBO9435279.1 alpha/beta hydrolase [Ruegeria sp. R13_0]
MSKWILRSVVSLLTLLLIVILAFRGAAFHRETVPFAAGLPDEGRLLETTEGSFFILETGSAENPRVLFAHGTAAWSAIWRETMYELSKADYFASAFDMPPFGWSEYPDGNDFDRSTQADRVIALLETLDDNPIIVAHSVGAGPVSEAVLRRPDLVTGFVIVAGAIGLSDRDNSKQPPVVLRNSVLREYLTAATASNPLLTRKFLRDFMHRDDTATPDVVEVLQEPIVREGYTRAVSNWIPELFTTPDHAVSLKPTAWSALDLPVALIWGANDTVTPVSQGKELASLVPNSTLTIMKDVGHIPHLEAPADFSAELVFVLNRMTQPHKEERE